MALDTEWIEPALLITGDFETSGDPFAAITGDFDGQGISCGVLQWNIGQGSLQPMIRHAGADTVAAHMPVYGGELWVAVGKTIPQGLAIVRAWQISGILKPEIKVELAQFCASTQMRAQQIAAAGRVAAIAYRGAARWAADHGAEEPTKKEFCWFFDLITQNGGLKGLTLADVRQFIEHYGVVRTDDVVCDWLMARPSSQAGYRDSRKNGALWRDTIDNDDDLDLFVLSYLRSLKSNAPWQGVVLNRKAAVALKGGWVNGELMDFSGHFEQPAEPEHPAEPEARNVPDLIA